MSRIRQYRHLLLFVAVLIVPSALVAGLGWTAVANDRAGRAKDAQNRAKNAETGARTEIVSRLRVRLENIRQEQVAATPVGSAVKFVVWADGDRLVMPWDTDPDAEPSRHAREEREFARKLEDGELLELERPEQAAAIYRDLVQTSTNEHQRAHARVSLARVLRRPGTQPPQAEAEATGVYRDLLSLPSTLVDQDGYPFASIAALTLADSHAREVLTRVNTEVDALAALTLGQAYRWRDVVKGLPRAGDDEKKTALIEKLSARIAALEEAQKALDGDPDLTALRAGFRDIQVADGKWLTYRDLLLSRATAGSRRLIIAVRVGEVLNGLPFDPRLGGDLAHLSTNNISPALRPRGHLLSPRSTGPTCGACYMCRRSCWS